MKDEMNKTFEDQLSAAEAETAVADAEVTEEDSVTVEGEDTSISAEGYGLVEITAKKLSKESFRGKFCFHADFQALQDALADGGKVFGMRKIGFFKDGPIEVVFTIRVEEKSYHCEQVLFADHITEEQRRRITRSIRLEVARLALSANCHNNTFLGKPLPDLEREVGSPNWGFGIAMALLYGFALHTAMNSYFASFALGVAIGIPMSYLLRSVKYYFPKETK